MIVSLALAAPVIEPEPLDPLQACIAHAGQAHEVGAVQPADRIALVVGVPCHDDPTIPSLQFSSRDAEALGVVLQDRGYAVERLTTHVDRQEFLDGLDAVARALPEDGELVLYFSGHGVLRETSTGLQRFLVFSDTDLGRVEATGLSLAALEERVQGIDARRRVIVQDSCYAAGRGSKGLGIPAGSKALGLPAPTLGQPDTRLYASRFYELAVEDFDRGGSVYTRDLLDALEDAPDLDGDGCVGLLEAHLLAAERTQQNREGYQHPEWTGTFANAGCSGPALRGVVFEEGQIRAVEPGRIRGTRVGPGEWLELREARRWHLQAGPWAAARWWEVSAGSVGGEVAVTWRGPAVMLVGVRGAWAAPSTKNEAALRGGEVVGRLGMLSHTRVRVGPVIEGGVVVVDPVGAQLPVHTATLLGAQLRGQVELGMLYVALEGGTALTFERVDEASRARWIPMLAGGFGVRL